MASGGARSGSGRPGWRRKVEHTRSIDVRVWRRLGILRAGDGALWTWRDGADMTVEVEEGAVLLKHRLTGSQMTQAVPLVGTPCHFGGARVFFACPHCQRLVALLYLAPSTGFGCRRCVQLGHGCQFESEPARLLRQQRKAKARLTDRVDKPPGMHATTYLRSMKRITGYRACRQQLELAELAHMLGALRGSAIVPFVGVARGRV